MKKKTKAMFKGEVLISCYADPAPLGNHWIEPGVAGGSSSLLSKARTLSVTGHPSWDSMAKLSTRWFFVTFLGCLSSLFIWLSDLQPGDEKVTLNHLVGGGNSNMFYFHPDPWGNDPIWLINTFQLGWNHQLVMNKKQSQTKNLKNCFRKTIIGFQSTKSPVV